MFIANSNRGENLGHTAASSYVLAPTILESPAPLLARQWRKGFDIAKLVTGPLSLACGVAFGALAYRGKIEICCYSFIHLNHEYTHHVRPT